jgi:hypothetical protein
MARSRNLWKGVVLLLTLVAAILLVARFRWSKPASHEAGQSARSVPSGSVRAPSAAQRAPEVASAESAPASRLPAGCDALCPCCPSGRDCGADGCDAALLADEAFALRLQLANAPSKEPRPIVKLCTLGDVQRCAGPDQSSLELTAGELARDGLELVYELPVATQTGVFRKPLVLREQLKFEALTRAALCRGLDLSASELPMTGLSVYLDPAGAPAPQRCG